MASKSNNPGRGDTASISAATPGQNRPARQGLLRSAASRVTQGLTQGLARRDVDTAQRGNGGGNGMIEQLEERRLLVVLAPGEQFTFSDGNGDPARLNVNGDVEVGLIGAGINEFGEPELAEIPGNIIGREPGVVRFQGGFGARDGSLPAGAAFGLDDDSFAQQGDFSTFFSLTTVDYTQASGGIFEFFNPGIQQVPAETLAITTLAANPFSGTLCGIFTRQFEIGDDTVNTVLLASINRANGDTTVISDLTPELIDKMGIGVNGLDPGRDTGLDLREAFETVIDADFNPATRELYFVVNTQVFLPTVDGDPSDALAPVLFRFVNKPNDPNDPAEQDSDGDGLAIERIGGTFGGRFSDFDVDLQGIAFGEPFDTNDNGGVDSANLYAFGTQFFFFGQGDITEAIELRGIFQVDTVSADADGANTNRFITLGNLTGGAGVQVLTAESSQTIDNGGDAEIIDTVLGLDTIPGQDEFLYALIGDGADTQIARFRLPQPGEDFIRTRVLGGTRNGDGLLFGRDDRVPGENLSGFTYSPTAINAFRLGDDDPTNDSQRGAFFATDTNTDQLLQLNAVPRFINSSLYAVVYDSEDVNGLITLASVADFDVDNPGSGRLAPFEGSVGAIGATPFRPVPNPQDFSVQPAANTGGVLVGQLLGGPGGTPNLSGDFGSLGIFLPDGTSLPDNLAPGIYGFGDIGRVLVAGTVTGRVDIKGSVETFYAGSLLTGNTGGVSSEFGTSFVEDNFAIDGDIGNLLTLDAVGTVASQQDFYRTGFELAVSGRIGQIVSSNSGVRITGLVLGNQGVSQLDNVIQELETARDTAVSDPNPLFASLFAQGLIPRDFYNNDNFNNAQFIGTGAVEALDVGGGAARINGRINGGTFQDQQDWYALPLIAGQSITITPSTEASVAVFDPEGVLVASNNDDVVRRDTNLDFALQSRSDAFTVIAEKPGAYRIAVGLGLGSSAFAPTGGGVTVGSIGNINLAGGSIPYTIDITGAGVLSAGAIVARGGNLAIEAGGESLEIAGGDLGALDTSGNFFAVPAFDVFTETVAPSVFVPEGNIRDVFSDGDWGINRGTYTNFPHLAAPIGTLGRAHAGGDVMYFNPFGDLGPGLVDPALTFGRIQLLEQTGGPLAEFNGIVAANGQIGMIRLNNIDTLAGALATQVTTSAFVADVDNSAGDGIIGLIDVTGDFGSPGAGPILATGPGGNVRYVRVGGTAFNDAFFGGGPADQVTSANGQPVQLRDDSGSLVTITATPIVATSFLDESITVVSLPVRGNLGGGGAGSAILSVSSTGSLDISTDGTAEIGEITLTGAGAGVVATGLDNQPISDGGFSFGQPPTSGTPDGSPGPLFDENDLDPILSNLVVGSQLRSVRDIDATSALTNLTVNLRGGNIDVLSIAGTDIDSIVNSTPGEIVSAQVASIGLLDARTIGFAQDVAGVELLPQTNVFTDTLNTGVFPGGTPVGIVAGEIVTLRARDAVGNVITTTTPPSTPIDDVATGTIQTLIANSDGSSTRGVFEGIVGPILAISPDENLLAPGNAQIRDIRIGEGILTSGSGAFSQAGIYARGIIGSVTNQNGSDLRGDIVSNTGINSINIAGGGAIVDADIGVINGTRSGADFAGNFFDFTNEFGTRGNNLSGPTTDTIGQDDPSGFDSLDRPIFEIDSIVASGGIIGLSLETFDINTIQAGGFGLINSSIVARETGQIRSIRADGLGIRDTEIRGAADVTSILATGNGKILDVNAFAPGARFAAVRTDDPFSGKMLDAGNDLFLATETSPRVSRISGVTNAGLVTDTLITANRNIGEIGAFAILGSKDIAINESEFPSRISVGNRLGTLATTAQIDGLNLTAGQIGLVSTGSDLARTNASVSGLLSNVEVGGAFRGSSDFRISGRIGNVRVAGSMFATVVTFNRLDNLIVDGFFGGTVRVRQGAVTNVKIGQDVVTGAVIIVDSAIRTLTIGGDVQEDSLIRARGGFGDIDVGGAIFGTVTQV